MAVRFDNVTGPSPNRNKMKLKALRYLKLMNVGRREEVTGTVSPEVDSATNEKRTCRGGM